MQECQRRKQEAIDSKRHGQTNALDTHTYIQTLLSYPGDEYLLVDSPWPLLSSGLCFWLLPCWGAPEGGQGSKAIFQLVFSFSLCTAAAVKHLMRKEGRRGYTFMVHMGLS